MRILKILLLSTCLAAFGAGSALAATAPLATTGQPGAKQKSTKVVKKKKFVKKKAIKSKKVVKKTVKKKKKLTVAKATRPKKPSTDTESAPGSPPGSPNN